MSDPREPTTIALELEEHLRSFDYHTNAFTGTPMALGGYMGILHYEKVAEAVQARPNAQEWRTAADVWEAWFKSTGSPTFNLLACEVRRQADKLEAATT